jgi:hypothetical protein
MENGNKPKPQKKRRMVPSSAVAHVDVKPGLRARLGLAWARFLAARMLTAAVVLYLLVCAALLYPSMRVPLEPGVRAPHSIMSPRRMEFVDTEATERARARARNSVEKVYVVDISTLLSDTRSLADMVSGIFSDTPVDKFQDVGSVRDYLLDNMYLDVKTVDTLVEMGRNNELQKLVPAIESVVDELTDGRTQVEQGRLENIETRVQEMAPNKGIPAADVPVIADILKSLVARNRSFAAAETEQRRDAAALTVTPVVRITEQRATIVKKGALVTASHMRAFSNAGLSPSRTPWLRLAGSALLLAFLFVMGAVYIRHALPDVYADDKKLFMLFMLIFMTMLWALMLHMLNRTIPQFSPYAMGAASGVLAILACFLVQPQAALAVTPMAAAAIMLCLGLDPGVFLVMLAAGLTGYFFSMRRQDMDSIMKAGLAVSAVSIVIIAGLHMIRFTTLPGALMDTLVFGAANGLLTAVIATGLLPLFERVFNVITPHRLLELSNPEHPLLKKLLLTAPGTYHHCIFVGNLAETAAEAVGADPLLVRIACYYHDVGKLNRPYFFAENQLHGENPLDDKSPSMGALIIYQHLKEGVEMLREHKLPDPIIRIASEHHGTCLISFFYQQARSLAKDPDTVSEERFRYPGPTPSTLESAIVMLSDGCEAAVRSLKEHSTRNIENTVNAIVKSRLVDGQFDHCRITLDQIDTVRKTLIETLSRIYHARVEYPDEEELRKKLQDPHAPNGRQSGKAS